jgi:hypothetical protein
MPMPIMPIVVMRAFERGNAEIRNIPISQLVDAAGVQTPIFWGAGCMLELKQPRRSGGLAA